jgi:large subunit ribosomal protein L5
VSPEEKKPARTRAAAAPKATAPKAASAPKATSAPKAARATKRPKEATAASAEAKPSATKATAAAENGGAARAGSNGGYRQPEYAGLRRRYRDEVAPALQREFGYGNTMQIPRLDKVVVNIGLGEAIANAKALDAAVGDLATITGQKPIVTRAKRSIAQFRLRTGMPIGAKVTLRGQRMYDFLERTMNLALPRIRDFRGIPTRSFDGRGNFSVGLKEQLVYPEIDYDKIDRLRGLEISIVTTAKTDEEGRKLLELLGMPFQAT